MSDDKKTPTDKPRASIVRVTFRDAVKLGGNELSAWIGTREQASPYVACAEASGMVFTPGSDKHNVVVVPWSNVTSYERARPS